MRKTNTKCIVCNKPLYRKPGALSKTRYTACDKHRGEALKLVGKTEKQEQQFLNRCSMGGKSRKGTKRNKKTKEKMSKSIKKFWKEHPDLALERGSKIRGDKHYRWQKDRVCKLNKKIRLMPENMRWKHAVKDRDNNICIECDSTKNLEAHHIISLSELITTYKINSIKKARKYSNILWNLLNGETLCKKCHYKRHGRTYNGN